MVAQQVPVPALATSHDRPACDCAIGGRDGYLESKDDASGAGDEGDAVPTAGKECV